MASISKLPNGSRVLQYFDKQGNRKTIHLGRVDRKSAETIRVHVEHLVSARYLGGLAVPAATAGWLATAEGRLRNKLVRAGLVPDQPGGISAAIDLATRFPAFAVSEWIGHTEAVSRAFYLRITPQLLAAAKNFVRLESAAKSAAHKSGNGWQEGEAPLRGDCGSA